MRIYLTVIVFILSCSTKQTLTKEQPAIAKVDTNAIQVDSLELSAIKLKSLYRQVLNSIKINDTTVVVSQFEQINEEIGNLSEEDLSTLLEDTNFVKLSKEIYNVQLNYVKADSLLDSDQILAESFRLGELLEAPSVENPMFEDTLAGKIKAPEKDSVTYGIPVVMNKVVKRHMKYLLGRRGRITMKRWLERGMQYEKIIRTILREEGVPEDLYYLAMIESGFNLNARSWASAVGPWQFIKATGKYYGLNASYWADDRRDLQKSTRAAARHLRDLYKRFGDWYLAMAGYNCNPAKIARRVRAQKTTDYFKLKRIPRETKGYVPQFIAAMVISKNAEKYGFEIDSIPPLEYDRVYVSDVVDLNHIAKAADTTFDEIKRMNPAILKWVTPSDRDSMYVNVPPGYGDTVLNYIKSLPEEQKQKYVRYRIKFGDAISLIARKFGVRSSEIKRINKMRSNSIRAGKYLVIPVPANQKYYAKITKKKKRKPRKITGYTRVQYKVKSGDTLGGIAEVYKTRAQKIRQWNGLRFRQAIRVGQTLTIYKKNGIQADPSLMIANKETLNHNRYEYHKVRSGESLWDISKKYDVNIAELKAINNLNSNIIRAGNHIIIKEKTN